MDINTRMRGCLLGLACGDAVGTTVEFCERGSFPPVTDMIGGGPFNLPAGAWTDDTSMALCLASSLVEVGHFDPSDQMKRYCQWYDTGYMSSTGRCFDIGLTVRGALVRYQQSSDPYSGRTEPQSAGNGCIMRLAPVPLFFYPDRNAAIYWAGESSRTTHGAPECIEACKLLASMICIALSGGSKDEILFSHRLSDYQTSKVRSIAAGDYRHKSVNEIFGTGYVIHCLEASAWCFYNSESYKDATFRAVNLGDDADTTGAVCGQIAGSATGHPGKGNKWDRLSCLRNLSVLWYSWLAR
ncbi:MAG: ADP-ribosylglycohydrolase family protein [Zavarzinella sp.]